MAKTESKKKPKVSARLEMFSDREFLQIVHELEDQEGWVSTEAVAERIFPVQMNNGARLNAIQAVGVRLGWMHRFGVVEKGEAKQWGLTPDGVAFARGKVTDSLTRRLESIPEDQLLEVTHLLSNRLQRGNGVARQMMRREWRHGEAQLRLRRG